MHHTGRGGIHRAAVHRATQIRQHPLLGVPLRPVRPGDVGHRGGTDPRLLGASRGCGTEGRSARGVQRGELTPEPLGGGAIRSAGRDVFGDQPLLVMSVHLWHRRAAGYPKPAQARRLSHRLP